MINNENSYYSKYLKYKKKYLDLKHLLGGNQENESEVKKSKEEFLMGNSAVALYINSFESINNEPFCNPKFEEIESSKTQKIIQFDSMNVGRGNSFELEQFKELHSNWENMSFGEVKKIYRTDIDEYCKLYQDELKSNLDEDAGLYGEFDDNQTKDKIEHQMKEEAKENNVTNLFSG